MKPRVRIVFERLVVLVVIVLAVVVSSAQEVPKDPSLSEVQRLTLENVALKDQLKEILKRNSDLQAMYGQCQAQLGPLQYEKNDTAIKQQLAALTADVNQANPHHTWDPNAGFTPKVPSAKSDPKKDEGKKAPE